MNSSPTPSVIFEQIWHLATDVTGLLIPNRKIFYNRLNWNKEIKPISSAFLEVRSALPIHREVEISFFLLYNNSGRLWITPEVQGDRFKCMCTIYSILNSQSFLNSEGRLQSFQCKTQWCCCTTVGKGKLFFFPKVRQVLPQKVRSSPLLEAAPGCPGTED